MAKKHSQRVAELELAIEDVETRGQNVDVNGRTLTRADLKTLYAELHREQKLAGREKRGGIRVMKVVPE